MTLLLKLAFLFFIGSVTGWILELLYRRFLSDTNPERKWINPGFLAGPYLPLYGFSLCALYLTSNINVDFIPNKILRQIGLFLIMAEIVTLIEYIAGLIFIKGMKIKLWDYTNDWANIQGIICPKYTFYWILLSAIYYFVIHQSVQLSVNWLTEHLAFSFVMGFFYGVFAMDLCYSLDIVSKIHRFAEDNHIIIQYEALKEAIRKKNEEAKEERRFLFFMTSDSISFAEQLKNYAIKEQKKFKGAVMRNIQETAKKFRRN